MPETAGRLVLASPAMEDSAFARAVIVMIEHTEEGAMGLVVNRPSGVTLAAAWAEVDDAVAGVGCEREQALLRGGPVEGPLMVLHGDAAHAEREVGAGLFLATSEEHVRSLVAEASTPAWFCVGYCGWSAGQLDDELRRTSWVVGPRATGALLMDEGVGGDGVDLDGGDAWWRRLMRRVDAALGRLADNPEIVPEDPTNN